jgi:hypothetical protein
MARRVLFAGVELEIHESQERNDVPADCPRRPIHAPHLVVTPLRDTYGRLSRAEVERLHDELGRWLHGS